MKLNLKNVVFYMITLSVAAACSPSSSHQSANSAEGTAVDALLTSRSTSTVLQSRATSGQADNYAEACFSFQEMTHDQNLTRNDYDIEFSGTKISTVQVVDNIGVILDLGAISCKDIKNSYEQVGTYPGKGHGGYPYKEDRVQDPMFWLEYSDAMSALQHDSASSEITANPGHCYLVNKVTNDRRVLAVFHVQAMTPNQSLTLDEIEVFERQKLQNSN